MTSCVNMTLMEGCDIELVVSPDGDSSQTPAQLEPSATATVGESVPPEAKASPLMSIDWSWGAILLIGFVLIFTFHRVRKHRRRSAGIEDKIVTALKKWHVRVGNEKKLTPAIVSISQTDYDMLKRGNLSAFEEKCDAVVRRNERKRGYYIEGNPERMVAIAPDVNLNEGELEIRDSRVVPSEPASRMEGSPRYCGDLEETGNPSVIELPPTTNPSSEQIRQIVEMTKSARANLTLYYEDRALEKLAIVDQIHITRTLAEKYMEDARAFARHQFTIIRKSDNVYLLKNGTQQTEILLFSADSRKMPDSRVVVSPHSDCELIRGAKITMPNLRDERWYFLFE